jgi:hypothetical protein
MTNVATVEILTNSIKLTNHENSVSYYSLKEISVILFAKKFPTLSVYFMRLESSLHAIKCFKMVTYFFETLCAAISLITYASSGVGLV